MTSGFVLFTVLLIFSTTFVQAHPRVASKRRFPSSTKSQNFYDDQHNHPTYSSDSRKVPSSSSSSSFSSTTTIKNPANEQQIEEFTRMIFERLEIKEVPNVTLNGNDGTGIPSIVQTLEQEDIQYNEELHAYQQQKSREDLQATTERAILPGDSLPSYSCQRQIAAKINLNRESLHQIECFRFTKSSIESKALPTNQLIKRLRLYVRKNYFHLNYNQEQLLTPDMFQMFQVFRPASNDTRQNPMSQLTDTIRLPISQVKQLNRNWYEFTIDSKPNLIDLQQIYQQFLMPWYGLGISHVVQSSWATFYRRYYSKKSFNNFLHSNNDDDIDDINGNKQSHLQLPYMLVEYGEKIATLTKNRGQRNTQTAGPRLARPCDPKSPCCRRPLTIDLDQGTNALNFVIYPRQIDIGECVGVCSTSTALEYTKAKHAQYKNEPNSGHKLLLIHQSGLFHNRTTTTTQVNRPDQQATQCCSYSRTGGLELMYTTTNGGPIIRKYIPNMVVEECRCGSPATIQQV